MTLFEAGAIGLIVILAAMTVVWAVSLALHDVSIIDMCWGPGFVLLAALYCGMLDALQPRYLLLVSLVTIWGVRLGVHIFSRHDGEDHRYAAMRRARGPSFAWTSLFYVFWLQAVILWFIALPLLAGADRGGPAVMTVNDLVGFALFVIGFGFEAIGDYQLRVFRTNPANRGKVLDTGLWRYTRHPNYFGDAVLWWGLFVIATSVPGAWRTALSPALMTLLLLRVSGVTLLEKSLRISKPGYEAYVRRTPAFFPWFPRRDSPA
jgi:steroid 5-alpha reductase family enzyme